MKAPVTKTDSGNTDAQAADVVNSTAGDGTRKTLPSAAQRALAEAAARRAESKKMEGTDTRPKELQGPSGPEPTRFGDWEKNGIASDF